MTSNILAALEANDEGAAVWRAAKRLADTRDAQAHIVNVIEPAIEVYADLNFAPLVECASDWQRALQAEREHFFSTLAKDAPVRVIEGRPAHEIAARAEALDAEIIVIGMHNRKGLARMLGSTTQGVLNTSSRNLLAVHPESADRPYDRVLIAIDTGGLAPTVLSMARPFTDQASAHKVLSVLVPLATVFAAPTAGRGLDWSFADLSHDIERETRARLAELATAQGYGVEAVEVRSGDPRTEILAAARDMDADLIIMGAANRGALNRLLVGSVARGVLNNAPCDVFVSRESDSEPAA